MKVAGKESDHQALGSLGACHHTAFSQVSLGPQGPHPSPDAPLGTFGAKWNTWLELECSELLGVVLLFCFLKGFICLLES